MKTDAVSGLYRYKRKKFFRKFLFVFFLLVLFFSSSFASLFFFDSFKIKEIKVEGNSSVSTEDVLGEIKNIMAQKIWGIIPADRIFTIRREKIKLEILDQFKKFSRAEVLGGFSRVFSMRVEERRPAAILCVFEGKDCFFLDETGFVFENAPYFTGGVFLKFFDRRAERPQPSPGEYLLCENDFRRIFGFAGLLDSVFPVYEIHLKDEGVSEFHIKDGWYIIVEEKGDLRAAYDNLLSTLKEISDSKNNLEYIDLRFGSKVYYKYKQ